MSRPIEWTEQALKDVARLDRRQRERIILAVERLAATGYGDVARLQGYEAEWRLRVGDWRVRFTFTPDGAIRILRVLPRGSAYQAD